MATLITSQSLREIRVDIDAALAAVGAKHGLVLKAANATYNAAGTNATFKLEVNAVQSGEVVTKEAADLKQYMRRLGLNDSHLTQVFRVGGMSVTLTGYRRKASTKPFLVKTVSGDNEYIVPADMVYSGLGIEHTKRGIYSDYGIDLSAVSMPKNT